jgi:hypothetical protein
MACTTSSYQTKFLPTGKNSKRLKDARNQLFFSRFFRYSLTQYSREREKEREHPHTPNAIIENLKVTMMGMALTTGLRPTWRCTWVQ